MSIYPICNICDEPIYEDKCYDFQDEYSVSKIAHLKITVHHGFNLDHCICEACMDKQLIIVRTLSAALSDAAEEWIEKHHTATPTQEE